MNIEANEKASCEVHAVQIAFSAPSSPVYLASPWSKLICRSLACSETLDSDWLGTFRLGQRSLSAYLLHASYRPGTCLPFWEYMAGFFLQQVKPCSYQALYEVK